MKKLLILILLAGCKKIEMRDPITDGAKLTKADAGRITNYSGTWWSEAVKDSLVIELRSITDSVRYRSNMPQADPRKKRNPISKVKTLEVGRLLMATNVSRLYLVPN